MTPDKIAKPSLRPLSSMTPDELADLLTVAGIDLENIETVERATDDGKKMPSMHPTLWAHYDTEFDWIELNLWIPPGGAPESEWDERMLCIGLGQVGDPFTNDDRSAEVVTWFMEKGFVAMPASLTAERDHLQKFKAYVHQRLDAAGVPADPESPHKAEGCRVGGRLDWLFRCGTPEIAERVARLQSCVGFLSAVIKSGEGWSETCQKSTDEAMERSFAPLTAPPAPGSAL